MVSDSGSLTLKLIYGRNKTMISFTEKAFGIRSLKPFGLRSLVP
jgi:hypothetical protein